MHRLTGAEIVTGPVLARYEAEPPEWVLRGRFFEKRRLPTGTPLHFARTSNVLISSRVDDPAERPFPEAFALNGGDDTYFFKRAHMEGHRIVWSDEARVLEWAPASRMTVPWLLGASSAAATPSASACATWRTLRSGGRSEWPPA